MIERELQDIRNRHEKYLAGEEGGEKADLRYANLRYADLRYANLRYADLRYADLRYADLREANLSEANLSEANLRVADLREADLRWANLRYADLRGVDLRGADLIVLHIGPYGIYVQAEHTRIGCQDHPNAFWLACSPEDVKDMADDAKELWEKHGEVVKAAIRSLQSGGEKT